MVTLAALGLEKLPTRTLRKVLVFSVLAGATPVAAQDRLIQVQIDRTHTVMAEAVALSGGYVDIVLPQATGRPLRLPVERVTCTASNCPVQLAELAQAATVGALPKNSTGFQIHGSNTIGAELMPRLVQDFLKTRSAHPTLQRKNRLKASATPLSSRVRVARSKQSTFSHSAQRRDLRNCAIKRPKCGCRRDQ
jgi:hypothetical protein